MNPRAPENPDRQPASPPLRLVDEQLLGPAARRERRGRIASDLASDLGVVAMLVVWGLMIVYARY